MCESRACCAVGNTVVFSTFPPFCLEKESKEGNLGGVAFLFLIEQHYNNYLCSSTFRYFIIIIHHTRFFSFLAGVEKVRNESYYLERVKKMIR